MDDVHQLRDRLDRLSKAIELSAMLEDVLAPLLPRRSVGSTDSGDTAYSRASKDTRHLEELLAERLRKVSERRNAVVSPIYRLDDDTWQSILLYAYQSTEGARARISTSIRLSHVSRQWRRIALDTAVLWTSRILDIPPIRNLDPLYTFYPPWGQPILPKRKWEHEMATTFSKRSKAAFLERTIEALEDDPRLDDPWLEFGRVKTLTANLKTPEDAIRLFKAFPNDVETFQKLEIGLEDGLTGPVELDKLAELFGEKVARVRDLRLSNGYFSLLFGDRRRCAGFLQSCKILHISGPALSRSALQTLFDSSPALRTLKLHMSTPDGTDESYTSHPSAPRILMLDLEDLELNMPTAVLDGVLDLIRAPSLRSLALSHYWPPENVRAAQQFLQSSAPHLHHFATNFPPLRCLTLLADAPTITSFTYTGEIDVRIPESLTPADEGNPDVSALLCPRLETITYDHMIMNSRLVTKAFLEMIRQRMSLHTSNPTDVTLLRSLNLRHALVSDDGMKEYFQALAWLLGDGLSLGGWRLNPATMEWYFIAEDSA